MTKIKKPGWTRRTLRYYWRGLTRHKFLSGAVLLSVPLWVLCGELATPFILGKITDRLLAGVPAAALWTTFWPYLAAAVAIGLASRGFSQILNYASWYLENRIQQDYLAPLCFSALIKQSMTFHNDRFGGSMVSAVNKFISAFELLVDTMLYNVIALIFEFVFSVVLIWQISPLFVGIMLIFIVIFTTATTLTFRRIQPLSTAHTEAVNRQSGQLSDSVSNILSIKSYGREAFESARYAKHSLATRRAYWREGKAYLKRDIGLGLITVAINALLIVTMIFGGQWFGITIGSMIMIISYTNILTNDLWHISAVFRNLNRSFGDAQPMTQILDEPVSVIDRPGAKILKIEAGAIELRDLTFTHHGAGEPLFNGLNLTIPAGQRIGLVGHSGGGKTTLTKLILRFADLDAGEILIDGQNIAAVSQVSLRQNIAYVPQEASLFHRSIADNIAYGRPGASQPDIVAAAEKANALEFIKRLPQGFDTLVGERGVKLSGGQRQRIAIARAILKDAPILILDEATASLDSESEKLIQEALQTLMNGRTSIVIAHRLSTVKNLDRIAVLENGKIVEDGTHTELIKNGRIYARLWNTQTGLINE